MYLLLFDFCRTNHGTDPSRNKYNEPSSELSCSRLEGIQFKDIQAKVNPRGDKLELEPDFIDLEPDQRESSQIHAKASKTGAKD